MNFWLRSGVTIVCFAAAGAMYNYFPKRNRSGHSSPEAAARTLPAADRKINSKDGLIYVWIPPGSFTMGCSLGDACHEKPAHAATLTTGFWMGQTEVTQEAYERITGSNRSEFKGAKLPVDMVSWNEAQAYCSAVGMRLPTEAEWEYAARAGNASARYGPIEDIAWYEGNSGKRMHEVGQKPANAFGLFDMLGNVWEWVADWYGNYSPGPATDPQGPSSGVLWVTRGGGWFNDATNVNAWSRAPNLELFRKSAVGFRCVGK